MARSPWLQIFMRLTSRRGISAVTTVAGIALAGVLVWHFIGGDGPIEGTASDCPEKPTTSDIHLEKSIGLKFAKLSTDSVKNPTIGFALKKRRSDILSNYPNANVAYVNSYILSIACEKLLTDATLTADDVLKKVMDLRRELVGVEEAERRFSDDKEKIKQKMKVCSDTLDVMKDGATREERMKKMVECQNLQHTASTAIIVRKLLCEAREITQRVASDFHRISHSGELWTLNKERFAKRTIDRLVQLKRNLAQAREIEDSVLEATSLNKYIDFARRAYTNSLDLYSRPPSWNYDGSRDNFQLALDAMLGAFGEFDVYALC